MVREWQAAILVTLVNWSTAIVKICRDCLTLVTIFATIQQHLLRSFAWMLRQKRYCPPCLCTRTNLDRRLAIKIASKSLFKSLLWSLMWISFKGVIDEQLLLKIYGVVFLGERLDCLGSSFVQHWWCNVVEHVVIHVVKQFSWNEIDETFCQRCQMMDWLEARPVQMLNGNRDSKPNWLKVAHVCYIYLFMNKRVFKMHVYDKSLMSNVRSIARHNLM